MQITALGPRVLAWAVDAILALMVTGLLMTPLVALSDPDVWRVTNPVPLLWALVFVLMPLLLHGATPGKRWMKLEVHGTGCLICREMRRSGWALVLGVEALLAAYLPYGVPDALVGIGIGLLLWELGEPLLTRADDFPHNRSTDFAVSRRVA